MKILCSHFRENHFSIIAKIACENIRKWRKNSAKNCSVFLRFVTKKAKHENMCKPGAMRTQHLKYVRKFEWFTKNFLRKFFAVRKNSKSSANEYEISHFRENERRHFRFNPTVILSRRKHGGGLGGGEVQESQCR